ncbi:hypothetical protein L4D15_12175 [Enterovibrio norvegicus]|uniref:Uncharacterized protein n=1 Tax=Enterovibrio norvegicus DSM 15893 TaxID=1121869 RepID=A0A1I5TZJ1_9GAMM|nr:hypothetical protein [Enterovibrio norvegicus]OEE51064.1 hypothetical protein A1OS_23025 [Enterovibrio norvegicus]PMH62613.1 hypothetical protein BCU62_19295 [Enterovibrio norvegicus]SFP88458.1 hypothetical protein SAMN03084138_03401 [Enterovibrio norvegicus DSM 15893]
MSITTDTYAMRETLERLNKDATNTMDKADNCTVKLSDLSTLLAAYKIELNKGNHLRKLLDQETNAQ